MRIGTRLAGHHVLALQPVLPRCTPVVLILKVIAAAIERLRLLHALTTAIAVSRRSPVTCVRHARPTDRERLARRAVPALAVNRLKAVAAGTATRARVPCCARRAVVWHALVASVPMLAGGTRIPNTRAVNLRIASLARARCTGRHRVRWTRRNAFALPGVQRIPTIVRRKVRPTAFASRRARLSSPRVRRDVTVVHVRRVRGISSRRTTSGVTANRCKRGLGNAGHEQQEREDYLNKYHAAPTMNAAAITVSNP